jgi:peptidoglycan/xylan/chitin deacetylase (PgdA/CDA1 family)
MVATIHKEADTIADRRSDQRMSKLLFILNFHGLGRPSRDVVAGEQPFWIDVAFFEAVLDLIQSRKDVQVTFDDSNESDFEIALPALVSKRMTAKFFVLAQQTGRKGYLSTSCLRSIASAGMTIGNHGIRHCPWTGLNEHDLHEELVEARDQIEQVIGVPVREAACPFGSYNRRVLRALRNSGYGTIYTSDECPATAGSSIQSRYSVLQTHDLLQIEKIINPAPWRLDRTWGRIKMKLRQLG